MSRWGGVLVVLLGLVGGVAGAQPPGPQVRVVNGTCGENITGAQTPLTTRPTRLRGSSTADGRVTLRITGFAHNCGRSPNFTATVRRDGVIELAPARSDGPMARCMCLHDVRLGMSRLPGGEQTFVLKSASGAEGARTRVVLPSMIPGASS